MSTILPNIFTSYNLTKEESIHGTILTTAQKQCIQNQIALLATSKINLRYDPQLPHQFVQQEAELAGQLIALQYLITLSDSAESSLNSPQEY